AQNPGHRPGRYPELGTDPVLAPPLFATHHHDRFLDVDRSLGGTAVRPRRAVLQAATAFLPEASDPAVSALSRDALGLRSVSDCPALLADALDEQLPTTHVQPGITVGHEDLRTVGDLDITHRTRRSSLASMTRRVCHQRPGRVQLAGPARHTGPNRLRVRRSPSGTTAYPAASPARGARPGSVAAQSLVSPSPIGVSPSVNSMVRLTVSGRCRTAAATAATSSRLVARSSRIWSPIPIDPRPGSSVSLPGPRMVQSRPEPRRWLSAAALDSA